MFKEYILKMSQYKPPLEDRDPSKYLLLDFNERTIDVSDSIKNAIIDYIKKWNLNIYPKFGNVSEKIAKYSWVKSENIIVTNWSDRWIDIVFRACCEKNDEVIIPIPTFAMFEQSANIQGAKILKPEYTLEKWFPLKEILNLISNKTKLIVICNPNNPTWTLVWIKDILKIAKKAKNAAILVDECYFEYSKVTVKDYINEYKNIFITRTFSKTWWMPSLRIWYIISNKDNINELLKIRWPYDVSQLAIVAIEAALKNKKYVDNYINEVLNTSLPLFINFLEKNKIKYWPTQVNFVLFYTKNSKKITIELEKKWILVRPREWANINDTIRITLWTKKDTLKLIKELQYLHDKQKNL